MTPNMIGILICIGYVLIGVAVYMAPVYLNIDFDFDGLDALLAIFWFVLVIIAPFIFLHKARKYLISIKDKRCERKEKEKLDRAWKKAKEKDELAKLAAEIIADKRNQKETDYRNMNCQACGQSIGKEQAKTFPKQ